MIEYISFPNLPSGLRETRFVAVCRHRRVPAKLALLSGDSGARIAMLQPSAPSLRALCYNVADVLLSCSTPCPGSTSEMETRDPGARQRDDSNIVPMGHEEMIGESQIIMWRGRWSKRSHAKPGAAISGKQSTSPKRCLLDQSS